ncbi:TonB family protein [Hymenobacter lutimineralis]|uniref:TonB family protein n=2 Tax=Hymenobacter lutimineralis TaxID=2606448 RepID=A0A5D6UTH7_9BACT|nr:TonB family protein [Hymenobacter lutimineralis]
MKALLLLLGLLCWSWKGMSQSMPAIYLNEQGEEVVPDSATHYRIIDRKTETGYTIREHALNGTLLLKGFFTSIDPVWRSGLFTWYHPNGTKASQVHFEDDEPEGVYVAWYENGKVRERGQFEGGQRTGRWVTVHRNGQKRSEGRYLYGRPVGEWRYYYDTGQLSAIELLSRAKGPALAFFNPDGSPYVGKLQRRQMPEFPGGEQALLDFISRTTQYPRDTRRKGISGKVYVSYTVGEDGRIGQVRVVRGLAPEADNEARRVVESLPQFQPGREYNVPTAVTYTVPISFAPNFSLFGNGKASRTPPSEARVDFPGQHY